MPHVQTSHKLFYSTPQQKPNLCPGKRDDSVAFSAHTTAPI